MPRGKRNPTAATSAGQPRDLFKVSDIKEDALIETVTQRAGVPKDEQVTGFIKSVIPRFSDWSANQGIKSISNMAKEYGKPTPGGSTGSTEQRATANGDSTEQRRRPGRPKGSRNKGIAGGSSGSNDKGQAAGGKRRASRPSA